ncbi:DUF6705 family protein [Flavobacterium sp.]|uniref:DUF6705 family protein n=1 Tax=Flavobacterium sp. TaxID=239 RepID=UPI003751B199
MKKTFYLLALLSLTFCKAQTPVIDLYGTQDYGAVSNAYYKDVYGFLNQYVGTWLYTNGTTSLKITFIKKEQLFKDGFPRDYYEDMLVGEYQYIENGIEKVNTLNQINVDLGTDSKAMEQHNLGEICSIKFPTARPKCNECSANERRLLMALSDPNFPNITGVANSFVIRRFQENGITKLKIWFYKEYQYSPEDENGNPINFTNYTLPFGEYILIKQ